MRKYYLCKGEDNFGPFSFEELKSYDITGETMVWFIGLDSWTMAKDVPELKPLFSSVAGAQPRHETLEKQYMAEFEDGESFLLRNINLLLILFFVLLAFVIGVFVVGNFYPL